MFSQSWSNRLPVESLPCVHITYLCIFNDIIRVHVIALFILLWRRESAFESMSHSRNVPNPSDSTNQCFVRCYTQFSISIQKTNIQHQHIIQYIDGFFSCCVCIFHITMRFGRPLIKTRTHTHTKSYRRGSQLTSPIIWNWIMANRIRLARPTVIHMH